MDSATIRKYAQVYSTYRPKAQRLLLGGFFAYFIYSTSQGLKTISKPTRSGRRRASMSAAETQERVAVG